MKPYPGLLIHPRLPPYGAVMVSLSLSWCFEVDWQSRPKVAQIDLPHTCASAEWKCHGPREGE